MADKLFKSDKLDLLQQDYIRMSLQPSTGNWGGHVQQHMVKSIKARGLKLVSLERY